MKRLLFTLLAASLLAACAGQPRTEPPAPVESSRSSGVRSAAPASPQVEQEEQTVEVYAYRPPSSAPDALPVEAPPVEGGMATGSMTALPSEQATPVAGGPAPVAGVPASTAPPVVAYSAPPPTTTTLPPAADGLARQAEQQRQTGDYVGAAATLERALRIQPQEAYLWNRLARVRMEQGSYGQAGNLAKRSNALAKDQPQLKQDNWGIIAVSRRAAGDAAGAMEAEQKARGG